jgi:hypothetical protein
MHKINVQSMKYKHRIPQNLISSLDECARREVTYEIWHAREPLHVENYGNVVCHQSDDVYVPLLRTDLFSHEIILIR